MERFGPFSVVRELDAGQGATVYEARKEGDAEGKYVLKVFAPAGLVEAEETEAHRELRDLLLGLGGAFSQRVELQKKAAEESRHFVPILATGQDEHGTTWYAAPLYTRSIKGLLEQFVDLEVLDLLYLVASIVTGALELKKSAGRSHGNLKPSNIFLEGVQKPRNSQVLLSDPLPGTAREAQAFEKADLRALGEVLYQLVLRRRVDVAWVMSVEASPEWSAKFGKQGAAWLALCNRLLDPHLDLANVSLESVQRDLRGLKPPRPVLLPALAVTAAVVLVGIGFSVAFGGLRLVAEPRAAKVTIRSSDGRLLTEEDARKRLLWFKLPSRYDIEFKLQDYETVLQTNQSGGFFFRKVLSAKLQRVTGRLRLTVPDYAGSVRILTNGHEAATLRFPTTNNVLVLPTGTYDFAAQADNGARRTNALFIRRDKVAEVSLSFTPSALALTVSVKPDAAQLASSDGAQVIPGVITDTTVSFKNLRAGNYTLRIEKNWYEPHESKPGEILVQTEGLVDYRNGAVIELSRSLGDLVVEGNRTNIQFTLLSVNAEDRYRTNLVVGTNSVPTGTNTVEAKLAPWSNKTATVVVLAGGRTNTSFTFQPGSVVVTGIQPEDAEVRIYDESKKQSGAPRGGQTLSLPPGTYSLVASKEGFDPQTNYFTVRESESTNLPPISLQQGTGVLVVRAEPALAGAEIVVSDAAGPFRAQATLGPNGQFRTNLPPRTFSVEAKYPGLAPVSVSRIAVVKGAITETNLVFDYWLLSLDTVPSGAAVKIDAQALGTTPIASRVLKTSTTNVPITLELAGYRRDVFSTNAARGVSLIVSRMLRPMPKAAPGITNSVGMSLVWVPGVPGAGMSEIQQTNGAWVGMFEVTQREYTDVMGSNPSTNKNSELPVESVTWSNAMEFCQKLTQKDKDAGTAPPGVYTLPTTNQWLFFARNTDSSTAVVKTNRPAPVGTKPPNDLGLYDVCGNISEWLADVNAKGERFSIGNSYNTFIRLEQYNLPKPLDPEQRFASVGFRVLRLPSQ
jgi:hypothetical protein